MIRGLLRSRNQQPTLPARQAGRVVAIASGKGGVGKTWFSVTLSHALARLGERVLLLDGDLGLANVDIQLGLVPEHDLASVVAGKVSLADAILRHGAGFDILAGRSGSGALSALDPMLLERVLGMVAAEQAHDRVLLDLGAGVDRSMRRMAAAADTLLVVVTDDPTSLTDAYAVLKLHALDRPQSVWEEGHVRVVINQATSQVSGERTYATLARACEAFIRRRPDLAGIIRRDDHVRDAVRRQTPLLTRHPSCDAARDVERVAASLV